MKHLTDEQISELLDGLIVLTPRQQEHLHHCPECKKKLEEWQNISHLLQKLPLQSAPDKITAKISHEINSLKQQPQKVYFPSFNWNLKSPIFAMTIILFFICGISILYYIYEDKNTTDTTNIQSTSTVSPIATNNNYSNNVSIVEEVPIEENILNRIGEQYIQSEPFEEELHEITISELLLSLAEETEEYNISDVSL